MTRSVAKALSLKLLAKQCNCDRKLYGYIVTLGARIYRSLIPVSISDQ